MSVSAGIFFYSLSTDRHLYLLRNDDKNNSHWGIPGGKIEENETLYDGLQRECIEELGIFPNYAKLIPIQKFINNSFVYHTFFCSVSGEFIPILNKEHFGYAWIDSNVFPKPLHPGLYSTVNLDVVKEKIKALIKKGA